MFGIDERWITTEQTVEKIKASIGAGSPFSMVRIGDGEYMFVENEEVSLRELETIIWVHFGRQAFPDRYVKYIAHSIISAAKNADVIGLFRGPLILSEGDGALQRVLHSAVRRGMIAPNASIVNADIHSDLLTKRLYGEFLDKLPFLGIIGCRDVGRAISGHFGIPEVRTYFIPEQAQFVSDYARFNSERPHFPDHFFELERTISVPFPGAVFLVGAGVAGKAYCEMIKARGGVAIDIGSVFDAWDGVMSRSQFSNPMFNEISSDLRLHDRRDPLPEQTIIESAQWLVADDHQEFKITKATPLRGSGNLQIEKVSAEGIVIANGALGVGHKISISGKEAILAEANKLPEGASIFKSATLATSELSSLQSCSTQGDLCFVLNSALVGPMSGFANPESEAIMFGSSDLADALQLFGPYPQIHPPQSFKITADPVDFWLYCDYEVVRPVAANEFATAATIGFDDGKTTITLRSGLNSVSQAAIIFGDEHAVSFIRYDFAQVRRVKVLISFSERQMLVASNGHLFQPRAISARIGRPRKLAVGSYINGAHVLGGRIFSLGFGSGVIGKSEMVAITS